MPFRLSPQSIEALAEVISGGSGMGHMQPIGLYRSAAKLGSFMRSCNVDYGSQGENALQRRSPDFRLIELPSLVMNREKSRGYAIWSSGWTGGTIMFWLEGGKWRFATISSWVT